MLQEKVNKRDNSERATPRVLVPKKDVNVASAKTNAAYTP